MMKEFRELGRKARAMTRQQVIVYAMNGKLRWLDAADILGISPRQMRRLKTTYERREFSALMDQRGKVPRRKRITTAMVQRVCELYETRYRGFNVKHFHEHLLEKHRLKLSYTTVKVILQDAGLVPKKRKKSPHRLRRERRPSFGMMLHMDGSRHRWLEDAPEWDLILAMDDATSKVVYGKFVPEENSLSCLEALEHILKHYGLFAEWYTDMGSHFCRVNDQGQGPASEQHGQLSRICQTLGIRQIFARSPQARGRSERAFGTVQDRLVNELRLHHIRSYEEANRYLQNHFIPDFNQRFCVPAAQQGSACLAVKGKDLRLLLSLQYPRIVKADNTVRFERFTLQIPPSKQRYSYAKCTVTVHRFTDRTLGVSYAGKLLVRFSEHGLPLNASTPTRSARRAA
ncbi:MAG: ISNCY family transposase [Myxococcales bacterium]|nr:ISNCY family transposase [Myxococcales bacterium]